MFVMLKDIGQVKFILTNFAEIRKSGHFTVGREALIFQVMFYFAFSS